MTSPGEDIRLARAIYAHLYGEETVWREVRVMAWMREAQALTERLKLNNLQETLKELKEIPINIEIR